jgi:cell division septal protein FtsQ
MAAAKRKKSTAKKPVRKRRTAPARRPAARSAETTKLIFMGFISLCIIVCLGAMIFLGYRTVTASNFFDVKKISVLGTNRTSPDEIENLIKIETEKTGTWDADLDGIKSKIEKMPFVKRVSVSRILPGAISVNVEEKIPVAVIRLKAGDFLFDADGNNLAPVGTMDADIPFVLTGWNETRSKEADDANKKRMNMYREMIDEWRAVDLIDRVKAVDLSDIREPKAVAEDSGMPVKIAVGKEKFAQNLKQGIEAIAGKGETFSGVDLLGSNLILAPRKQ